MTDNTQQDTSGSQAGRGPGGGPVRRDPAGRSVSRITDPKAMRALAHPTRLALLGLLRIEGPLTATKAAELLGESSASCSFHLRQLGKYGLVEEAGGGQGRERPWRAAALFTDVPEITGNPEFDTASSLFRSIVADGYFDSLNRWLEVRPDEPAEWQAAAGLNDALTYLTAAELAEVAGQVMGLLDGYADRLSDAGLRPPGSRLVQLIHMGFPITSYPRGDARAAGTADGGAR